MKQHPTLAELAWSDRGRLRAALRDHPLVLIRKPGLSPDELAAFGESVGEVEAPLRVEFRHPDQPKLMQVGNVRDAAGRCAAADAQSFGWHSDMSYRRAPPELTLLYAKDVPSSGGDTHFASLLRIYDELDEALRAAWASAEIVHESCSRYFDGYDDRTAVHPLIATHPESHRPLVFASPAYTKRVIGVPEMESDAILDHLRDAIGAPDVVHRWTPGDLIVWDNRALLHRATAYDTRERRALWRMSVRLAALA